MKYANLRIDYERESDRMRNFGDDIQMRAIQNLYDYMRIDEKDVVRITVQELFSYDGEEYLILPISYPLYGVYNKLSNKIIPIFLGLSILSNSVIESLRLKEFEPIGCRDQHSLNVLRESGVNAYLNGCMTMTFPKRDENIKGGTVFIVDVCDELMDYIPEKIKAEAEYHTHLVYHQYVDEMSALKIYDRYKKEAKLVITSRLHCAVPCMAYGIPVIFACKKISFRSVWLQNLIPLYDLNTFKNIDWNPKVVDIEDLKEKVLFNAKRLVENKVRQYSDLVNISEIYEDLTFDNFEYECMRYPIEYMKKNWETNSKINYMIWGITQTSELLYQYISKHYKRASLVGVIDLYRKQEFHGIGSRDLAIMEEKDGVVFVAVESANVMAVLKFKEYNKSDYVLCWQKQDYKLPMEKRNNVNEKNS